MTDPLSRDAPGDMRFGETVTVKTVVPEEHGVTVTFDVFGSYVEVAMKHPLDRDDRRNCPEMNPHVNARQTARELGDDQEEYITGLAVLVAGTALGWFA